MQLITYLHFSREFRSHLIVKYIDILVVMMKFVNQLLQCFFGPWVFIQFLGTFAELQKVTVSFVISVHLYAWNYLAPIGQTFLKFDI